MPTPGQPIFALNLKRQTPGQPVLVLTLQRQASSRPASPCNDSTTSDAGPASLCTDSTTPDTRPASSVPILSHKLFNNNDDTAANIVITTTTPLPPPPPPPPPTTTTLTGAIRDFLKSPHCAVICLCTFKCRNCVQITCNTSGAFHAQHTVCHVVRIDSSAIKFDRAEIAFILASFHWLKPLTDERGEETEVPGETSDDEPQKMPHAGARKFKPKRRL